MLRLTRSHNKGRRRAPPHPLAPPRPSHRTRRSFGDAFEWALLLVLALVLLELAIEIGRLAAG